MMDYTLEERRRQLYRQIQEWNQNRLDLFAISEPNQNLEFFGVLRFYYQDDEGRVSTKCIRVSSTATTADVIHHVIEKFRPDLRMLSRSQYGLYEVHVNGEERRLGERECPLLVQLHWGRDDREGRFLLKNESHQTVRLNDFGEENTRRLPSVTRKFSGKEGKKYPKQSNEKESDAQRLYHALPDSGFTRSISNPEIVMQRRRQAKLERKLNEIRASEQGPDAGGTLKIYGHSICPEVPYKTLLLSVTDDAFNVVKETLEKYKLEKDNPNDYCLVKVVTPGDGYHNIPAEETVLNDYDCPLDILYDNPQLAGAGCITFHLRCRADSRSLKGRFFADDGAMQGPMPSKETLPYLTEVNPDGTKPHDAHSFTIPLNGLEIGRERSLTSDGSLHLQLTGHDILLHHCIISCHGNIVTVAPLSPDALVAVNNCRVYDRAKLENGMMLMLGKTHFFRFHDPLFERINMPVNNISAPALSAYNMSNEIKDLLPAILEYREEAEDHLLSAIITEVKASDVQFKLLPTYLVYMVYRFALIGRFRSGMNVNDRLSRLNVLSTKVVGRIYRLIEENQKYAGTLAFWMANSSELLNFLSRDRGLRSHTLEAQDHLADCVQMAFTCLVHCLQEDLNQAMPAFLEIAPDVTETPDNVVRILSSIIAMLLTTNVNAALTIQLFSQMFHFINMWLFNRLVRDRQLCTREWGRKLRHRLSRIEVWSEKQGLELAAECHLGRIIQSAQLLELPKRSADDITVICSSCYKLNSLQLKKLLENYIPAPDEPSISPEFINRVVGIAQNTADETARNEGQEIRLMEDSELRLPFLMPDDGYSCEFIRGILKDVVDYIEPLNKAGICRLIVNKSPQNPSGLWTVHFSSSEASESAGSLQMVDPNSKSFPSAGGPPVPEVVVISFRKINNSLGLSIVAAIGVQQGIRRIFVKSVVPGGAAAADGRLQAGDELLEVDGQSLIGMTQEGAAAVMSQTGQLVTLKVAKQSAVYYGLATQLGQQSPPVGISSSPYTQPSGGFMPHASSVSPPGAHQPYPARLDDRDSTLRRQQGTVYPQHQATPPGLPQNNYASASNISNYPPEYLRRSQPTLGHLEYNSQPPFQPFGQPALSNGEGYKSSTAVPTGGRYPRAIRPPMDDRLVPIRSKSVPDFDEMDYGGETRVRPAGSTLPGRNQGRDSMYQQRRPGEDNKRPVLYPSMRGVYSGGNYPPMRPVSSAQGPRPLSAGGGSFAGSKVQHQYGRSGRPANPASVRPGSMRPAQTFLPSQQASGYGPPASAEKLHPMNGGRPRAQQFEDPGKDPRTASSKGSTLTRHPNVSGLNTIGLNDWQEPQAAQNRTGNTNAYPYLSQVGNANPPSLQGPHPSSVPQRYNGPSIHQEQPLYHGQKTQRQEGYTPPIPPPPSDIYASVSKATAIPNHSSVGPGPVNVRKEYQDQRWNPPKSSDDARLRQIADHKEPEYAQVRPRANVTSHSQPLASRSSVISPWVREEQEVAQKRREEEKRQLRAQEIFELSQRPNLTKEEMERLKRLKLEAEFDRRLEEVSNQDDQDDDTDITPAGRAKLVQHYQQEYELRRQQMEEERLKREKNQMKEQEARRHWQEQRVEELDRQRAEERQMELRRQEEQMNQKENYLRRQRELRTRRNMRLEDWYRHNHQMEEERRREEMRRIMRKKKTVTELDQLPKQQRSNLQLPQRPSEPVEETYSFPTKSPQIPLPPPPPPPERSSSFEVYRTGNAFTPLNADINNSVAIGNQQPTAKKSVSFQRDVNAPTSQFHTSGDDFAYQRPNGSLGYQAKTQNDYSKQTGPGSVSSNLYYQNVEPATPFTPGTNEVFIVERGTPESSSRHQNSVQVTPGVVGNQEHYLGPREKIAAAKMANAFTAGSYTTPDRMSFRDKMKHFANEAGEEAPKDRSKISRAQQRLETDLSIQ